MCAEQAVYRVRRFCRKGEVPKKYLGTFELIDDHTKQVMAVCDLIGKATFTTTTIKDHEQQAWQMKPNRNIMPSRWVVSDPRPNIAMQFDQKIVSKMANPLQKTILALLDDEGKELYRLADPRTNIPDRIMGAGPDSWELMRGDTSVATVGRLSRQSEPSKGFLSKLKKMLANSERGMISADNHHALPAPLALAMVLLLSELTENPGG